VRRRRREVEPSTILPFFPATARLARVFQFFLGLSADTKFFEVRIQYFIYSFAQRAMPKPRFARLDLKHGSMTSWSLHHSIRISILIGTFQSVSRSPLSTLQRCNLIGTETKEKQMNAKPLLLAGIAIMVVGASTALAGPCDTVGKSAQMRDAGSGPTPGNTGQTTNTGSADASKQSPATSTMNRATGGGPASSEDAQKQMQGQPTAAQQAQGAKSSGPDC
jgi:hypothetical protein